MYFSVHSVVLLTTPSIVLWGENLWNCQMSALREREAADLVLDIADLVRDARIMG